MNDLKKTINKINESRIKRYFNLAQLEEITGMSSRALKYRMLKVKEKYKGIPTLLKKEKREWRIHYTIINEFAPKYNLKNKTLYTLNWSSMATWNPKYNYDEGYHLEVINQIKHHLPDNYFAYAIEQDSRGVNHSHIISDASTEILSATTNNTLLKFIENPSEFRVKVEKIHKKYSALEYIRKMPKISGII